MDDLEIAGKKFKSRLITGTGKHRSSEDLKESIVSSGTEMITVAIRRINFDNPKDPAQTAIYLESISTMD